MFEIDIALFARVIQVCTVYFGTHGIPQDRMGWIFFSKRSHDRTGQDGSCHRTGQDGSATRQDRVGQNSCPVQSDMRFKTTVVLQHFVDTSLTSPLIDELIHSKWSRWSSG